MTITLPAWLEGVARARAGRFRTENDLQYFIETELRYQFQPGTLASGIKEIHREQILPGTAGRIDFSILATTGRWGIECKIKASPDTWRQLNRYAPHFDYLVLVTTRAHGDPPPIIDAEHRGRPVALFVLELWQNL